MDLKFKIIAEAVQGGWDKSKSLIDNLKAKFDSMFNGAKAGWAKIGSAAVAAGVAMYKIGESWRQSFLAELKTAATALENFVQDSNRNLRKIKFQDTDTEKARNLEDIGKQIRERRKRIQEIDESQSTESIFGRTVLDTIEKTGRKITGRGFTEAEEVEREKLENEVKQLENQLAIAAGKKTKDEEEAAGKARDARIDKAKKAHEIELAWLEEEKNAAEEAEKAKDKARQERLDKDKARHESELAWIKEEQDARKKAAEMAEKVSGAARDFAYSQADPAEKVRMDRERLAQLSKEYMRNPDQRGEIAQEAFSVKGRIADAEKQARAVLESERKAQESARKSAAGQSLSAGDLFTNLYGQGITRTPEQETADRMKEAVDVLKAIEKKTGAAP